MSIRENILRNSFFYSLSQFILAPGAQWILNKKVQNIVSKRPIQGTILDIGCGPKSWLWQVGLDPIGIDISNDYSKAYVQHGTNALTGSSTELPIKDNSIDGVWCIGVLHHLDDNQVSSTINEMQRVVSAKGYIVILDAILPEKKWLRPLASLIRQMDRGTFMRSQSCLEQLLSLSTDNHDWRTQRYTYTATGLEMLECLLAYNNDI